MTSPILGAAPAAAAAAAQPGSDAEKAKLKEAAKQFEAVFLRQLIGSMRSASLGDGVFDSSETEQFRSMMDAKTADTMAGKGVLGVADMLVKQYGARVHPAAATQTQTPK